MRRLLPIIALSVVLLAFVGCAGGSDGASLINKRCDTSCHSVDWVTGASQETRADWKDTVRRMEAKGLEITDEERTLILEHLEAEYGAE